MPNYNFTTDKAAIAALSEVEKLRLICALMSNKNDISIDWDAAATRMGSTKGSMNVMTGQILRKLKAGNDKANGSTRATTTPGVSKAKMKASPQSSSIAKASKRKEANENDKEAAPTPSKKVRTVTKAVDVKKETTDGDSGVSDYLDLGVDDMDYVGFD